jgi:excisionase family DNA binding protein
MNETLLLKPNDAAKLLQVSQRTLWAQTKAGTIPAIRLGHAWRYSREALRDWIGSCSFHNGTIQSSHGKTSPFIRTNAPAHFRS